MKLWIQQRIKILSLITVILVGLQLVNSLTGGFLNHFGILPRSAQGLSGILFSPFLHRDWEHLLSNLPILLILSALLLTHSVRYYAIASTFIILFGGLLVWIFARSAIHIGASGWIFGLWMLLLANAFTRRKLLDFVYAILILLYYGGLASGLLPGDPDISTEGHIAGAVAGLCFALLTRKLIPTNNTNTP